MTPRRWIAVGAAFAFVGVAAGAFGAHGLKNRISAELLGYFETAVRYQLIHALAILFAGLGATTHPHRFWGQAAAAFAIGIGVFSGSLYALVLTDLRWFGAITPIGGVAFLTGWALVAAAAWKQQ